MNSHVLFEKKDDTRGFPLVDYDTGTSDRNLYILFAITIISSLLIIYFSNISNIILNIVLSDLLPLVIVVISFNLLTNSTIKSFFRKIKLRDFGFGLLMLALGTLYSSVATSFLKVINYPVIKDSASTYISSAPKDLIWPRFANYAIGDLLETFTEEFLAIFALLILASLLKRHTKLSRGKYLTIAWIFSMFVFGSMHFSAYNYHFIEMYLVIGFSRFFDTGIFLRTKNVFITFFVHYVFDTLGFLATALAASGIIHLH